MKRFFWKGVLDMIAGSVRQRITMDSKFNFEEGE